MDEAFHSLDLGIKMRLMESIHQRWKAKPFALLCVTHDPKEALYLADRIVLLSARPASVLLEKKEKAIQKREITSPDFLAREAELIQLLSNKAYLG